MPNLEKRLEPDGATRMQRVAEWTEAQLIGPMLEVLSDARERKKKEIDRLVEERLGLPAGELRRDSNEVDWAKSTLTGTRCVEDPRNPDATKNGSGIYRITQRGKDALDALRRQPDGFRPPMRIRGFERWLVDQGVGITPGSDEPQYRAFRGEVAEPASPTSDGEPSELYRLASELYVDEGWLREVVELLEDPRKHQVIFYGPPGTGKTYIARKLARFLTDGNPQRSETVQFHPSYSYEDFVQGYRPRPGPDGTLTRSTGVPLSTRHCGSEIRTSSSPTRRRFGLRTSPLVHT
jgi:AAA domain (dynein-related subfamily)/Mrr N-terminal domain